MKYKSNYGKSKSGQIQMGETIAVIIVVIIILFIAIVFWNRVSNSNVKEVRSEANELATIGIANIVPEMQELKCYESSVSKVKCLDLYKILAMSNALKDTNSDAFMYYNNYFKNSKITISIIYPEYEYVDSYGNTQNNITLYDAQLANSTTTLKIYLPANVKDYVTKKTYYGIIIVDGYYKQE